MARNLATEITIEEAADFSRRLTDESARTKAETNRGMVITVPPVGIEAALRQGDLMLTDVIDGRDVVVWATLQETGWWVNAMFGPSASFRQIIALTARALVAKGGSDWGHYRNNGMPVTDLATRLLQGIVEIGEYTAKGWVASKDGKMCRVSLAEAVKVL